MKSKARGEHPASNRSMPSDVIKEIVKMEGSEKDLQPYLDRLPVGVIQLDRDGSVIQYNYFESLMSGLNPIQVLGKNFFTEVAPCTTVNGFYEQFKRAVEREDLDITFDLYFAFPSGPRQVQIRLAYSNISKMVWCIVTDQEKTAVNR
ncbi:MAG: hypothetical protein JWO13_1659 [Acidobacteriales bacterium]|nr:hypothetical protein [Terriglobales bacterium]